MKIAAKLRSAQALQEVFELVRDVVWKHLRADQAGLMPGTAGSGIEFVEGID